MATSSQPGKIACPHCQGLIKSPPLPPGSPVTCPKCGQSFRLGEIAKNQTSEDGGRRDEVQGPRSKVQGQASGPRVPLPPPPPMATVAHPDRPSAASQIPNPKSQVPNPKPRPPDTLVDPNLLPPPPPRQKPKPTEVAVVCPLCGTRTYAPLDKIGQEIKCPDCHSRNVVPPLPGTAAGPAKPAGPTLEGTEEYGMSEVVERPKYRPLVVPRGEYEVLSAMDPAAIEHRLTVPGEKPRRPRPEPASKASSYEEEEPDEGEIALAPAVERAEAARDPRSILPQLQEEPENEMYDGRYDDGVIGDNVDPRSPDAWKRAPLVYGIVEFLFYPSTLPRWLVLAALLAMVAVLGQLTLAGALSDDGFAQLGGVLLILFFVPTCAVWVLLASGTLIAVVDRTANGNLEIDEWPGWNFLEWIPAAGYWVAASVVAAIPGVLIGILTMAASPDWGLAAFGIGAPPVLSWLVLFPLVLFSMLAEDSYLAVFSSQTATSFSQVASAWVYFYMYTIMLCLLVVLACSLFLLGNIVGTLCGSLGLTLLAFVYARLLGRVMWIASQHEARLAGKRGSG